MALLALWAPISSHELLEHWGIIHVQTATHTEKENDHHDAADGLCRVPPGAFQVQKFCGREVTFLAPVAGLTDLTSESVFEQASFALVNPSPPDIPVGWQFSYRAALPARAPSLIS